VTDLSKRHPGTVALIGWLTPNPNLPAPARNLAAGVQALADYVVSQLPDDPELTAGLRKLLEAKDCFVRAQIGSQR
jgi:hypothetical protein